MQFESNSEFAVKKKLGLAVKVRVHKSNSSCSLLWREWYTILSS